MMSVINSLKINKGGETNHHCRVQEGGVGDGEGDTVGSICIFTPGWREEVWVMERGTCTLVA